MTIINSLDETQTIMNFMANCSAEVTPNTLKKIEDISALFKPAQPVYVTFLPGSRLEDTLECVKRLKLAGYTPIPHIAARSIVDEAMLTGLLQALAAIDVKRALLIAGGVDQPLGIYHSSMDILKLGLLEHYGFTDIGLAGHPEGSPDIPEESLIHALKDKNAYADASPMNFYLITQFCFEAKPIIAWDKHIQAQAGNRLPIHIGLPGLATLKTLIKHAQACGIGSSMRVLTRQAGNITKLLMINAPDKLTRELAYYQHNDPDCGIRNCHLYPLGSLQKSLDWMHQVQAGNFDLAQNQGFNIKS